MLPLVEANALSQRTPSLAGKESVSRIIGHTMPISILCKGLLICLMETVSDFLVTLNQQCAFVTK